MKVKPIHPSLRVIEAAVAAEGVRGAYFEYPFALPRRFRFDVAWPAYMVAFEREGGTWGVSRHTGGKGYRNDCRKYNLAASLGWYVVRATVDMIRDGTAVTDLLAVLKSRETLP